MEKETLMRLRVALLLAAAAVVATVVGVSLALRTTSDDAQAATGTVAGEAAGSGWQMAGNGSGRQGATDDAHAPVTGEYELSAADAAAIAYMREEEKLARDVYVAMYDAWGLRAFQNISASESRHMEAVEELIDAYGLTDPAADTAPGEFQNSELQDLYDELVADGSASLEAALKVGVLVEQTDIADLEKALEATDNPEVTAVLGNLLDASQRHLSTFERQLSRHAG